MSEAAALAALQVALVAVPSSSQVSSAGRNERGRPRTYGRHARLARTGSSDGQIAPATSSFDENWHYAVSDAFELVVEAYVRSRPLDRHCLAVVAARRLGCAISSDLKGSSLYASVPTHLLGVVTLSCALALIRGAAADAADVPIGLFASTLDCLLSRSLLDEVRCRSTAPLTRQARSACLSWLAASPAAIRRELARTARRLWRKHGLKLVVQVELEESARASVTSPISNGAPQNRRQTLSILQCPTPRPSSSLTSSTAVARHRLAPQLPVARPPLMPLGRAASTTSAHLGKRPIRATHPSSPDTSDDDLDLLPSRPKRRRIDWRVDMAARPLRVRT